MEMLVKGCGIKMLVEKRLAWWGNEKNLGGMGCCTHGTTYSTIQSTGARSVGSNDRWSCDVNNVRSYLGYGYVRFLTSKRRRRKGLKHRNANQTNA